MKSIISPRMQHLIVGAVERMAPEVAVQIRGGGQNSSTVPAKTYILNQLLEARGPQAVLDLAKYYPVDSSAAPLFLALLNSATPGSLIEKLGRYDRFYHGDRRLELLHEDAHALVAENIDNGERPIAPVDDLFVCGSILVMLGKIGCRGVSVVWESAGSPELVQLLRNLNGIAPPLGQTSRWRFTWTMFDRPEELHGLDEYLYSPVSPLLRETEMRNISELVRELLEEDLNTRLSMGEVASRLGLSPRTLQRRLRDEDTTYSAIYQDVRHRTTLKLLERAELSLTEVGYLAGYADSAHFSREFRKITSMTPRAYRAYVLFGRERRTA